MTPMSTSASGLARPAGRLLRLLAIVLPISAIVVAFIVYYGSVASAAHDLRPPDAVTYLAAGERLNAGHALYRLSPGDRPVVLEPPYWTVPLLSPPLIAVVWRPLASLPAGAGVWVWWALSVASVAWTVVTVLLRRPLLAGPAALLLCVPIAGQLQAANLDCFILLGGVLCWSLVNRGHETAAGAIAGVLTVAKLIPAVLVVWLIASRRWDSVRAAAIAAVACMLLSMVGAGVNAWGDYFAAIRSTSMLGFTSISLAGVAARVGVPLTWAAAAPFAADVLGCGLVLILARRARASFAVAITTMVLGSPVIHFTTFPLLWPIGATLATWQRSSAVTSRIVPWSVRVSGKRT